MNDATTSGHVSPELLKVAERAKRHPEQRILALAHLIDEPALERAYRSLRRDAAVGVDGATVEQYGEKLAENLQTLRARMKAGQYRHQPIRRVNIPKENGTSRPIGVSTVEDKIVQGALREVLESIYEQDFLECSSNSRFRVDSFVIGGDSGVMRKPYCHAGPWEAPAPESSPSAASRSLGVRPSEPRPSARRGPAPRTDRARLR